MFNRKELLTVPNLLSLFRVLLIPVFVWSYVLRENAAAAAMVLAISCITDIADGRIARKYGAVSNFGKIFDPVADKLTQMAVLLCLISRFPWMLLPLVILAVKELLAIVSGLLVVCGISSVPGAEWHGKAATVSLFGMALAHLLFPRISSAASFALIILSSALLLLSACLYMCRNMQLLRCRRALCVVKAAPDGE